MPGDQDLVEFSTDSSVHPRQGRPRSAVNLATRMLSERIRAKERQIFTRLWEIFMSDAPDRMRAGEALLNRGWGGVSQHLLMHIEQHQSEPVPFAVALPGVVTSKEEWERLSSMHLIDVKPSASSE